MIIMRFHARQPLRWVKWNPAAVLVRGDLYIRATTVAPR